MYARSKMMQADVATVNAELAAKLEAELSMEKDMRDSDAFPDHLKEYLDNSPFEASSLP